MRRSTPAVVAATLVLVAGCGRPAGTGGGSPSPTGAAPAATVRTASTKLGTILVDGGGRTLYLFEKDRPNESACPGACVAAWPIPHSDGKPAAGSGVTAGMLDTIGRADHVRQVTYNGHPLYYYIDDHGR